MEMKKNKLTWILVIVLFVLMTLLYKQKQGQHQHHRRAHVEHKQQKHKMATDDDYHGDIDKYIKDKTDEIARSENMDLLWFKFVDNAILPDSGQVPANHKERLASRRSWTETACRHMKRAGITPPKEWTSENQFREQFIVSKEKRILYCSLPKVANTNVRRVFLGLQGVVPKKKVPSISGYNVYFVHDDKFTYLKDLPMDEQQTLVQTYRKFAVVRDPFERLLSGYRNKFFHPNPDHAAAYHTGVINFYRSHQHLMYRNGITVRLDFSKEKLRFEEFLVYVVDTYAERGFLDIHFMASFQLCDPCTTNIDYIAKFDRLYDDITYIFQALNIDIDFPGRNDNYYTEKTTSVEEEYYTPIPDWLLLKIWNILKYDYVLFGFSLPQWFKDKISLELTH